MQSVSILVADDQSSLTLAIKTRLEAEGFSVETCGDGYQALAKARKHPPNLLILDVHMPAGSGFSVLERMRTIPELEQIPVILITGDLSTETMLTADRFRIDFVIEKPFSGEDLVAHVRAALSDNKISQS